MENDIYIRVKISPINVYCVNCKYANSSENNKDKEYCNIFMRYLKKDSSCTLSLRCKECLDSEMTHYSIEQNAKNENIKEIFTNSIEEEKK